MEVFFLRLHFSELIASFFMVLGALLVWTFINRKENVFGKEWQKRMVAGGLMFPVMMIGMMSGLVLDKGHSWGSPTSAMGLAMQHTWRVFTNDSNLMLIGMLYVVFQIIGAFLALGVFLAYVKLHNVSVSNDVEKTIKLKEIFKFDPDLKAASSFKDAIGCLIITFAVMGASVYSKMPTGFPVSDAQVLATSLVVGVAFFFVISVFGIRGVLVQNPHVWLMAFILKITNALITDKKSLTFKIVMKECAAPMAVMGVAVTSGLIVSGILSMPYTEGPE